MRFMIIVKASADSEAGIFPEDDTLMAEMTGYHEALQKAGVLLDGSGLKPSSQGWRIHCGTDGKRTVVDGPFAETKELIAGYTVIQVRSIEEAMEWARRFPAPMGAGVEATIELRPLYEIDDFAQTESISRLREIDHVSKWPASLQGHTVHKQIFVNLAVSDLPRSKVFFEALGLSFNPQFTNEQGACLVIGENICAMLLTREFFKTFIDKEIADPRRTTEVLTCLSCDSRAEVDAVVANAVKAGGTAHRQPQDHGFMYAHGFEDLDGHIWELAYMDMSAMPPQ